MTNSQKLLSSIAGRYNSWTNNLQDKDIDILRNVRNKILDPTYFNTPYYISRLFKALSLVKDCEIQNQASNRTYSYDDENLVFSSIRLEILNE